MQRGLLTFFLLFVTSFANAGTTVHFASTPGEGSGYLAEPGGKGKHPAIIVIQEWWGLNDWIKENADRFAKDGYVALAPDLYRGKSTSDPNEAHELMRGLPEDRAMADLKGAFKYLESRKDVDAQRIAVIGWCMGGGYALNLGIDEPKLAGIVINYGHLVTNPNTIRSIKPPILGNFGAEDRGIPPKDVHEFEQALTKDGKVADIKIYDKAGHAFMNPNNKGGYVKEDADDAWKRIDAFLRKTLKRS
jgi:carboxymethylenebutenolidase